MTAILGISAFYHDSAAALVVDGQIVAAAQEERFSRKKHDAGFPRQAIAYCLREGGLRADQLDYVAFYEKPLRRFERLMETFLGHAPEGYTAFRQAIPVWMREKLRLRRSIRRDLGGRFEGPIVFVEHHESHAASAFFPSPFQEAAILTMDGVGEWATSCWGVGRKNSLELSCEMRFPHSLGLLYSAFTYYAGFKVNGGEYKLMGLAPYGRPLYRDLILDTLLDLKEDGSFRLNLRYFNFQKGLTMTGGRFHKLFGGPPRQPESGISQRVMDLAASVQAVAEEVVLRTVNHVHAKTGQPNLTLAGGVALNCVCNGRIMRESPFRELWIQPASGDAGGSLGAALFVWHQLLEKKRSQLDQGRAQGAGAATIEGHDTMRGSLLGPAYSGEEIAQVLDETGAMYETCGDEEELCERVAALLAEQKVVGWFQGRMEFGPRALGSRSILADPRSPEMQSRLNAKIKFRESFRPFAPMVLRERASTLFDWAEGAESPYMMVVTHVRECLRAKATGGGEASGLQKLKEPRPPLSAVTHVDYSARLQTVDAKRQPLVHRLLLAFERLTGGPDGRTGCPALANTSFNVRGEPIAQSPRDAWNCFMGTGMDALAIGRHLLLKTDQRIEKETSGECASGQQAQAKAGPRGPLSRAAEKLNISSTPRQLREFSLLSLVAFPLLAAVGSGFSLAWSGLAALFGLAVAVIGLARPKWIRPLYLSACLLAYPVGLVAREAALLLLFFLVFLPIGLLFRLAGRDPLKRRIDGTAASYWEGRETSGKPESYFWQW